MVVEAERVQGLGPAWRIGLRIVPGGEGRSAAVLWAMLAATGAIAIAEFVTRVGALKLTAAIGFVWLLAASFLASYQYFYAIPSDMREAMVSAGSQTAPGARFAVFTEHPRVAAVELDWFPTLSGRLRRGDSRGRRSTRGPRPAMGPAPKGPVIWTMG